MPGIAGIIGPGALKDASRTLALMVKAMLHEPFYSSGSWLGEPMKVAVGWACHKGSFSDCLPIWNERKDICLFFAGEHFADSADVERLRSLGHDCAADNAGCLIHLYEELGPRFFESLNGAFSGVLVDLRQNKIVLFNDRYGLNRVYYHENADGFYFASEAKSLLKVLPDLRRLDMTSLGEFFSCGCPLQNRTLFSGVSLLPGGARWTFGLDQQVKRETFFQRETWENQPVLTGPEYAEKLRGTFARVLPRYFSGQQRVAMSLTGGLDSRMIMAWGPSAPFKLECYTFGGPYRECSDVKLARWVAKECQQYHKVVTLNSKFFAEFPALAKRSVLFSDGAMDVSGAATLFVNKLAREIAPVRLTGNYGDQILRGHVAFRPNGIAEGILDREFADGLQTATATYSKEMQGARTSFIAFKQVPWHHYGMFAMEQTQVTVRSPYLDNDLVAVVYQAPPELSSSIALALRIIAEGDPALAGIPTDRGALGNGRSFANKAGSWYQGLTIRAEYAYDYGMPQWLAKIDHVFAKRRLERAFLGRHKFSHFRVWYRDQLSKYVQDVLLDQRTLSRSYLKGKKVAEIVAAHVQGKGNHTLEIHKLLTSEMIQRHLIEQK